MSIPIGKHSSNSSDWLQEFATSQLTKAEARDRVVKADYMSRLKQHVEEQRNSGRYVTVASALEDFSSRLGLSETEKTVLADMARYANWNAKPNKNPYSEEKLEEEIEEQGAPESILPGVKPNKKTNKQTIQKELAEDVAGDDIDGPSMPLAISGESNKHKVTAGIVDESIFEINVETDEIYLNLRVKRLSNNEVETSLKTNPTASPQIKKITNDSLKQLLPSLIGAVEKKSDDTIVHQLIRSEAKSLYDWLLEDFSPMPAEQDETSLDPEPKSIVDERKKKEKPGYHFSDDLDDIELDEEEAEKQEQVRPEQEGPPKEKGGAASRLEGLFGGKGISLVEKQKELNSSRGAMLGAVSFDSASLDTNWKRASTTFEKLSEKDENLRKLQKTFWSAGKTIGYALKYARQGMSLVEALAEAQELFDRAQANDESEDTISQLQSRVDFLESRANKFRSLAIKAQLSEEEMKDPAALLALQEQYNTGYSRVNQQLNKLNPKLEEAEGEMIYFGNERDRRKVADLLAEKLPSLLADHDEDFDTYFARLQEQGSTERSEFVESIKGGFNTTDPKQAKFVQTLTGFLTPEFGNAQEFKSIYRALRKHSGFLTIRPQQIRQIYQEQLASKTPAVERKRNQVKRGNQEFVASIAERSKLFKGYLPTDELLKASSVLLFGVTEDKLLQQNEQKARNYIEEKRREAIRELLEQKETSLMSNLGRLYNSATNPETENKDAARERYDALLDEAKKLVSPELRPYLIDPTEPIESAISEDLIVQVIRRVIMPEKLRNSAMGDQVPVGDNLQSIQGFDDDQLLPVLEKLAITNGYALEAYDVTLADHVNNVYMDQCSRFVGALTRKRNAYDAIIGKHSFAGKGEADKVVTAYQAERGLDGEWKKSVEKYLDLYDVYLRDEIEKNYKPISFSPEGGSQDLKTMLSSGLSAERYTKPAKDKVLAKIDSAIENAENEQQAEGQTRAREAFVQAVEARKKVDAKIVRAKAKSTQVDRLGEAANLVFGDLVSSNNFQVVVPQAAEQLQLTPDLLRKQIYAEAEFEGKQLDTFKANTLLQNAIGGFYSKAYGAEHPAVDALLEVFPTSKAQKEKLRSGLQKTLADGTTVAAALGANGIVTGGNHPIFTFPAVPVESGEVEGVNYELSSATIDKVDAVVTPFTLNASGQDFICWAGSEEEIYQQIDLYRSIRRNYSARFTEVSDVDKKTEWLLQYASDVEAISKFSKAVYRDAYQEISQDFSLENLQLSVEEAKDIWNNEVLSYLRNPDNPLGLRDLPGPPRSRWGKKGSANFVLDGNAWKIGRKSSVYQQTLEWLERASGEDKEDKEAQKRNRAYTQAIGKLETLLSKVGNYNPKSAITFPTADELLPRGVYDKTRRAKIQKLLDLITGKKVSQKISAEEAANRLLKIIRNDTADLQREKKLLQNNGRQRATLELTCPNPHVNQTHMYGVTYVVGNTRMGLLNSASYEEIEEVADWAEQAVVEDDLQEDARQIADRFKLDRFVILGQRPTCPICGFEFENVDRELSTHLQEESGKTVVTNPADYLMDMEMQAARASFDWVTDKLTWLEIPEHKDVTREESPFDIDEVESLPIAEVDQIRTPLIREILTSSNIEEEIDEEGNAKKVEIWEVPSTASAVVPNQKQWQTELYDLLQIWKRDLARTFGFKAHTSFRGRVVEDKFKQPKQQWEQTLEEGRKKEKLVYEPLLQRVEEGVTVGYVGDNYVAFNDDIDAQLAFYYDTDRLEPDVVIPKGHARYKASMRVAVRRADLVSQLMEVISSGDLNKLENIVAETPPAKAAALVYPQDLRSTPAGDLIMLLADDQKRLTELLEPPYDERTLTNLQSLLQETLGGYATTDSGEWVASTQGKYSAVLQQRLESADIEGKIDAIADKAVSSRDVSGGGIEAIQSDVASLANKYQRLTEAIALFQQDELANSWSWLTNQIIRIKDDKRKQAKAAVLSDEGEESPFAQVKQMFSQNQFPTVETAKEYGLDLESEEDLRRADTLLYLVNKMISEIDSQHPAKVGVGQPRRVGRKENLLQSFFKAIENDVDESDRSALKGVQREILNLVLFSNYGYLTTDPTEINDDLMLLFGRALPETNFGVQAIALVSDKLAELNSKQTELQDIRNFLSSKVSLHASMQSQPANTRAPDPRFFYRVVRVTPAGVHRAQGPKVNYTLKSSDGSSAHLASPSDIAKFLRTNKVSDADYRTLVERYVLTSVRGFKYATGSVKLELHPIVKETDRYYPARLGELTESQKVTQVPDTATRPAEYVLPMALTKGYDIQQFDSLGSLREVVEQQLSEIFDFASVAGESPSESKIESGIDYVSRIRRAMRLRKLAKVLGSLQ